MAHPESEGFNVDIPVVADLSGGDIFGPAAIDETFLELMRDEQQRLVGDERRLRANSFAIAHGLTEQFGKTFNESDTFHRTFVDQDGLPIERRAVMQFMQFPGAGNIGRLIVNDEGPAPHDFDTRQVRIRDFLISKCAKAFSWQETVITRPQTSHSWGVLPPNTGPLVQQRSDHISFAWGSGYATFLPRVGGYRTSLFESIERRMRLEEYTEILGGLSVATYEPGYEVKPYF